MLISSNSLGLNVSTKEAPRLDLVPVALEFAALVSQPLMMFWCTDCMKYRSLLLIQIEMYEHWFKISDQNISSRYKENTEMLSDIGLTGPCVAFKSSPSHCFWVSFLVASV